MSTYCEWTPTNNWYDHISDMHCVVNGKKYNFHSSILSSRTRLYKDIYTIKDITTGAKKNKDKLREQENKMKKRNLAVIKVNLSDNLIILFK